MEDYSVYVSEEEEEEEADDPCDAETDEDLSDEERDMHEVRTIYLKCSTTWFGFVLLSLSREGTECSSASRGYLQIDAGSVDEHSTKSDEEYEDLAMRDVMESGDWSDDEQQGVSKTKNSPTLECSIHGSGAAEDDGINGRYHHNLDLFLKMSKEVAGTRMPCAS